MDAPPGRQARNEFRGVHAYRSVGRLRPGVSLGPPRPASWRQVTAPARHRLSETDNARPQRAGGAAPAPPWSDESRPPLLLLLGAVVMVLLITCANLAALLVSPHPAGARASWPSGSASAPHAAVSSASC